MSEFIDYMNHQNKDSKVQQSWIKTDEYTIRQEDRKIDRHSFLNYIAPKTQIRRKNVYTQIQNKKESILCQLLHWLRCLWKEKKALKRGFKTKKRGKNCHEARLGTGVVAPQ